MLQRPAIQLVSRYNREIKGTQYKLNINPIYWLKKERKWGLGDKSTEYAQH